jgi:hypothetical protein
MPRFTPTSTPRSSDASRAPLLGYVQIKRILRHLNIYIAGGKARLLAKNAANIVGIDVPHTPAKELGPAGRRPHLPCRHAADGPSRVLLCAFGSERMCVLQQ